jgi:hypothetical protein
MIASQVEDILRSMFQKGMLKDIPQSWSEDEVVDFMSRLNDPILSKGKVPEKGDEDLIKAPEWAKKLSLTLDQLTDLVPVFRRMNQERTRKAEQTAQRTRLFNLETDEEKDLFSKEEKTPPKYPLEPEKYPYGEQRTKRGSDGLAMNSGTRRKEEMRRAEERGPVQAGSEELKRRLFDQIREGQRRENEALEIEREIKSLPGRIENLARKLIDIPFNKWSVRDMTEVERYFSPEQVNWLTDAAQARTERRAKS